MSFKFYLADTSVRQYRRRDGRVAFRLRSYLMIETNAEFRLSAYLKDISGELTLSTGERIPIEEVAFSDTCIYKMGVMMHDFWAAGTSEMKVIRDDIGKLRIDYHLSFTGHPYEEPDYIEMLVPLIGRGTAAEQFGRP
jgi:hypothetical protein